VSVLKAEKKKALICIAIPLAAGFLVGLLTRGGVADFAMLRQPPLAPPGWLFPVVWTILYTVMGYSSYLIYDAQAEAQKKQQALTLYWGQLAVNLLWPFFFFVFDWYLFSLFWLILLWILVFQMIKAFREIVPLAAYLNLPYLIWLTFAGYLNLGVWWLNR